MRYRIIRAIRYVGFGFGVIVIVALATAPFSKRLIEQWSRSDVEARSRLVYNAVQNPVVRAIADDDWSRLSSFSRMSPWMSEFWRSAFAMTSGRLQSPTKLMPATFSCDKVARSEAESFSAIVNDGRRITRWRLSDCRAESKGLSGHSQRSEFHRCPLRPKRRAFSLQRLRVWRSPSRVWQRSSSCVMLRDWMNSLRRAIDEVRSGATSVLGARQIGDRHPDQETARTRSKLAGSQSGPDRSIGRRSRCRTCCARSFPAHEVIIVSNREPYIHNRVDGRITLQTPASGLVSALEPVIRACGGTWIAHGSGTADRETVDRDDKIRVPPDAPSYTLRRIWVSDEEQDGYYYGLANEGLWPLCHIAFVRPHSAKPTGGTTKRSTNDSPTPSLRRRRPKIRSCWFRTITSRLRRR